jgi:hypothetical protein
MKTAFNISKWLFWQKNEAGSIVIESAFMIPLILFCGMGAIELSMAYMHKNSLTDMAFSYSLIIAKKGETISEKTLKDLIGRSDSNSNQKEFFERGRVILTAVDMPLGTAKPKMLWQRCSLQPAGKSFSTRFVGPDITLPTTMAPLFPERTYVLVEVFYDTRPLTGFFLADTDANGERIKSLADMKIVESLKGNFNVDPENVEAVTPASSSCS